VLGSKNQRDLKALTPLVGRVNELEARMIALSEAAFPAATAQLRERLAGGETLEALLPEAFALVREAARRRLGERIYDCQLMGGAVLHRGSIVEMKTGEGKTLSSVTTAYLNALGGAGVHIVTVNDYLAERDAGWMGRVFDLLGISVGVILANMDSSRRRAAYRRDVTYGTNNEFGFDYLRDNMQWDEREKAQRGHNFCIVDEIDSILIDEARTPLIISGAADDDTARFAQINTLVDLLTEATKDPDTGEYPDEAEGFVLEGGYKVDEKGKRISFTDQGMATIEKILRDRRIISDSLFTDDNFEFIHYFTQALRAHRLFQRDVDYVVQDGKVEIVDEFTGRILHGRRYSDGLHQAIEAKERIRILQRNRTLASITFQNYFKLYHKLAGMTGTADTEATEFSRIYGLDVVVIPTNRPVVRQDEDDVIFLTEQDKVNAICDEIAECNGRGQPVLVGTVSIEKSEQLASMLLHRGIRHEVLNAKNHAREATIIAQAGAAAGVTIATNMAGRGTDIKLGGNVEFAARRKGSGSAAARERALTAELPKWQANYDTVKGTGGLNVIGTERHESRRIDNQLRGRSGRQGDPGHSRFYISLDDDLMRLFGENMRSVIAKVGFTDGEPLAHPWINKSLERAQRRVEERNFETRKHLLDFDNVLNEQRKFIYAKRDEITAADNLIERVVSTVTDELDALTEEATHERGSGGDWSAVLGTLKTRYFFAPEHPANHYAALPRSEFQETLNGELSRTLEMKAAEIGTAAFNLFIRYEYLRAIDARWQDHLENLGALQEAVRLRAYSQKNPLLEYKLEGFQIFDRMLEEIRRAIAEKIFKITIRHSDQQRAAAVHAGGHLARHVSMSQFGGAAASVNGDGAPGGNGAGPSGGAADAARPAAVRMALGRRAAAVQNVTGTVSAQRSMPKVGRNEPCPCGSGKKYKHCHGT
jgi:preprotein translocase subunit SecA